MSDDVEATNGHSPRRDGQLGIAPEVTVQVVGLQPEHVHVVERGTNGEEPAVFIELAGDNCQVTLAGRLYRLQQVTAEVVHQLQQLEEAHRTAGGQ